MKRLLLLFFLTTLTSVGLYAQERTVTGTITSADGTALPGVNIIVKGTSVGTISDSNGAYSINVPSADSQLTFSFIGYTTQTVAVGSNTTLAIQLAEDVATLQEVVVSGLATSVKRENLANAVATLSAKDLMGTTTPVTTDGAFLGKVAGANIVSNGSMPGGGFNMQFRGISTLGGGPSQPLFIVDGVYIDNSQNSNGRSAANKAAAGSSSSTQDNNANRLADLNPDDIENVEILQGPSAAAIYGTRANAGVVIITTKRGKDGRTKISFGQDVGFSNALSFYGGADWTADKINNYFNPADVALLTASKANGTYRDWEKEIFGSTGMITNTRLGISGGDAKTKFYINGSRANETGIVKNTGFERNSVRANIDHKVTEWLDLGVSMNFVNTNNDRGWSGNDNTNINYGYSLPYSPPYVNLAPNAQGVYPNGPAGENPLAIRDRAINNQKVNRFFGAFTAGARVINNERSSLTLKLQTGIDYQNGAALIYLPSDLQSQKAEPNSGFAQDTRNEVMKYNVQFSAVYTHTAMDNKLNLTSSAGILQLGTDIKTNYVRGQGLPVGVSNPARAAVLSPFVYFEKSTDQGAFFQQEANYDDKVIATVGVRFDRSTIYADPSKLYTFPKASVAVNLHKFFDFGTTLSQVKLRAAYGQTAGPPGFGVIYSQLAVTAAGGQTGLIPSTVLGNPDIKPETASEFEYGVDFGFLNNRITAEITAYNKKTFDLILQKTLAPTTGTSSSTVNAADMTNTGMMVTIGAQIVQKPNFSWYVAPMFWYNRSEITRLDVPEYLTGGFGATFGQWRVRNGLSPTQIVGQPRTNPADLTSYTVYGDAQPKFEMSLNQRITFLKNFEFSALFAWREKFTVVSLQRVLWDEGGNTSDWNSTSMLRGSNGKYSETPVPNGVARQNVNGLDANGKGVEGYNPSTYSFVKLREIALYYRIPADVLKGTFGNVVQGIKVGVSGNNIWRWTDYTAGYDPENSNFGSLSLGSGVDIGSIPAVRRYMFHVIIDF
ncbi:hypothetical protein BH09BAC3_BH09BAC3_16370 [soil metagenome]